MACQSQQNPCGPLPRSFYDRDVVVVARDLLGKKFWRRSRQGVTCGTIVEVEAYRGAHDPASHSFRGKTPRHLVLFGSPGYLYVYSIHARFCLNAVTGPQRTPSAVLIRAIEPTHGISLMQRRRDRTNVLDLARGPARLLPGSVMRRRAGIEAGSSRRRDGGFDYYAKNPRKYFDFIAPLKSSLRGCYSSTPNSKKI